MNFRYGNRNLRAVDVDSSTVARFANSRNFKVVVIAVAVYVCHTEFT